MKSYEPRFGEYLDSVATLPGGQILKRFAYPGPAGIEITEVFQRPDGEVIDWQQGSIRREHWLGEPATFVDRLLGERATFADRLEYEKALVDVIAESGRRAALLVRRKGSMARGLDLVVHEPQAAVPDQTDSSGAVRTGVSESVQIPIEIVEEIARGKALDPQETSDAIQLLAQEVLVLREIKIEKDELNRLKVELSMLRLAERQQETQASTASNTEQFKPISQRDLRLVSDRVPTVALIAIQKMGGHIVVSNQELLEANALKLAVGGDTKGNVVFAVTR